MDEVSLSSSVVSRGTLRTGAGLIAAGALLSTVGFTVCWSAALDGLRRFVQPTAAPQDEPVIAPEHRVRTVGGHGSGGRHQRVPEQIRRVGTPVAHSGSRN